MDPLLKTALWRQFGATIDMLDNALLACPDALWKGRIWNDSTVPEYPVFWSITYHALFWLDFYLTGSSAEAFAPPAPIGKYEFDPSGALPEQPYTKEELHGYLEYVRQKCETTITEMSDERAHKPITFPWEGGKSMSFFELCLYNMRHVQEHAAQLNLFLGQHAVDGVSDWVPWAGAEKE